MAKSVGVAMAGGNPTVARRQHDFYPTPKDATRALFLWLAAHGITWEGPFWEPCCGNGAICRVAEEMGFASVATDLNYQQYGEAGHDLLATESLRSKVVITNPPFNIAPKIISKLMPMGPDIVVLMLKSTFWSASTRTKLFRSHPPSAILQLAWRPDFAELGGPTMEVCWFVWQKDHKGLPVYDVLDRPPGFEIRPKRIKKAKVDEDVAPSDAVTEAVVEVVAPPLPPRRRKPKVSGPGLFDLLLDDVVRRAERLVDA
jgi:hypothetical protein